MDNQNNMVNENPQVEQTVVPTVEPNVAPTIDPNVIPQNNTVVQNTTNEPTKSNKGVIIAVIAAIVLIGAGIGAYFAFFRTVTGKEVVNGTINKVFESAIKAADQVQKNVVIDYKKDIVKSNGNVKVTVNIDDENLKKQLNNLNSVGLDYDLRLDLKTLSGSLELTEKENDKDIISLNTLLKDKVLYLKTNATSSVLKVDLSDEFDWDSIDISKLPEYKSDSLKNIIKKLQGYLKDAIKEEYITQENGEFTVDGVTVKGLKTTITLNEDRYNEISKSIINSIVNDEEGLKLIAEFTMTDKSELKSQLEQARDSIGKDNGNTTIKQTEKKNTEAKINIYTTKQGKFLAFDALTEDGKDGFTAVSQNDVTTIKVLNDGKVSVKLDYNEKAKELVWKNDEEGNKNETIKIQFLEDGLKVLFTMDGASINLEFTEKVNNDTVSMNFKAGFDADIEGAKMNASLEYNNNLSKADSLNTFDTSNALNTKEATKEQQEQFTNELTTALENSVLFKLVQSAAKKNDVNQTNTIKSNIYTSTICSQTYECKQYTDDYAYCKYIAADGNIQTILCPIR